MSVEIDQSAPPEEPAPSAETSALHGKVLRGSVWTLGGIAASRVIRLANNLVLTRLMDAGPIGVMGLANVFMMGLQMFSDIGIKPAIIQHKRGDDEDFLNTAWTMGIIRGFALWAIAGALAWPYSLFYGVRELIYIVPVVGATAAIQGFNTTALATTNRKLALGRLTVLELVAQIINTVVVLIWAYFSPTPWALVAGGVSNAISYLVLGFLWLPGIKHRLRWEKDSARELIRFGRWVFVSTSITFMAMQCDPIAMGKIAGAAALAVYGIGKMWGTLPSEVFQQLLNRVFFPVMSDMVRKGALDRKKICDLRTRLLLPVAIGTGALFVVAVPSVHVLYRQQFWAAGEVFAITAISAWIGTITNTYSIVLLAAGKLKNMTASTATKTIVFFALVYPAWTMGHTYAKSHGISVETGGLAGVAIAVAIAEVVALVPMMLGAAALKVAMPGRELGLTVVGAIYGFAMYGAQWLVVSQTGSNMAGIVVVGVLTSGACLWCIKSLFAHLKRSA